MACEQADRYFLGGTQAHLPPAVRLQLATKHVITPVPSARIPNEWGWLAPLIAPAAEHCSPDMDRTALLAETRERLISGQYEVALVSTAAASGIVVSEFVLSGGVQVLWLTFVAGRSKLGPRALVRFMRAMMAQFEDLARAQGCDEIRIGGRDWSRVFPDFERHAGIRNELRKKI